MSSIVGTLATDDLKLINHRVSRIGLRHDYRLDPQNPKAGESVILTIEVGPNLFVDHIACYFTVDGSEPYGHFGIASNGQTIMFEKKNVVWDNLVWGYLTTWQTVLPAQSEGIVVRYRIGAWNTSRDLETFADSPSIAKTMNSAAYAFFSGHPLPYDYHPNECVYGDIFSYRVGSLCPPNWAFETIIYHIFVDRFYPGDGRAWKQTSDIQDFYGGTLWGICDKLDYIADLGATCIWLSPVWVSPSHHGYDIVDFNHIEPRLGGDEALLRLVDAAHGRGIQIILDLVCNHVSNQHPIFQSACNDPGSPMRDWFIFDDSEIGYRAFFNLGSMPQINLSNPDARAWMLDIACYWLREFKIDGYRLDHALGPEPAFWSDFRWACKEVNPNCFCFGEVVDSPDVLRKYVGRLDGCLDIHLSDALRQTFGSKVWTNAMFEQFLNSHLEYYPDDFLMPTFLDNHDMDRFLYISKGDRKALLQAASVQMGLPGPPIIYYGTEVGVSQLVGTEAGGGFHGNRSKMFWDNEQDLDLLEHYKRLIVQRRQR